MTITFKNATDSERAIINFATARMRDEHQTALDACNAAMRAINACGKSEALEKALEAMREERRPHLDALRILKTATVRYE